MSQSTVTDAFRIVLQKGIEGGFAPPTPRARYTIVREPESDVFVVSAQTRPHGKPHLVPAEPKELRLADYAESIAKLQALLRDLPVQYPGAQDLYGRNTSIVQVTNPNSLGDLHMTGSAAGTGIPHPTEEQKVMFDEAVAIIEKLKGA